MQNSRVKIDLVGPLKVSGTDGADCTPASKKGKGLLAILCTSPNFGCSRAKLQDKLWSDSPPEQGSNSLRQALTQLRQDLNKTSDVLISSGDWVGLDNEKVNVNLEPRAIYPAHMIPEFAEGLQINDAEFEDWIRDQRVYFEQTWQENMAQKDRASPYPYQRDGQNQNNTPTLIVISGLSVPDPDLRFPTEVILRDAAKRTCSFGDFVVVDDNENLPKDGNALRLSCLVSKLGDRIALHPIVMVERSRRTIWSQTFECGMSELFAMSSDISDALTLALLKSGNTLLENEDMASDLPLGDIFGYSQTGLYSADNVLMGADREREVPSLLSLRAYIRHTMIMERVTDQPGSALAEADEMVSKALERAPYDPLTLSVRSLISGLREQDDLALDYAQRAIQSDPRHAFARHSLSVALSFTGHQSEANSEALLARSSRLIVISPAIYFLRCSYTALGIGDEKEALKYAQMAHGTAPNFRPALRVIAALAFKQRDEDTTIKFLKMLKDVEPDFTLDLMGQPDYPVDSLRKANALEIVTSGLI